LGNCFLHPTLLNLHPTQFQNSENTLYSENENPELKTMHSGKSRSRRNYCVPDIKIQKQKIKISFWIKKSRTENNTFQKNLSGDYCVLEKGVQNVILYESICLFPCNWVQ